MTVNSLAFFDQLQGASYQSLSNTNFQLGIIDPDDARLTNTQISSLEASGKTLIAYLSIGEAENYRSYWQSSWNNSPPSFIIGENPDWPGNYNVKYWDSAWQNIMIAKATALAKAGYNGMMLDVVDAYTVSAVANADGGIAHARADMISFIEAISAATKAINPNFKVIQNNALDLLTVNPDNPASATNTAYLSHIDGVITESTFYNPDNTHTTWQSWNVQYLQHAVSAGKDVLAIDYPTSIAAQQDFIHQAIADHFIPFVGNQVLSTISTVNYQVPAQLPSGSLAELTGHSGGTTTPPPTTSPAVVYNVYNVPNGTKTIAATMINEEFVFSSSYHGNATIKYFGSDVGDIIHLAPSIYATAAQALSHVTYSGSNAIIHLHGTDTITLVGAGANSLAASDFHIG